MAEIQENEITLEIPREQVPTSDKKPSAVSILTDLTSKGEEKGKPLTIKAVTKYEDYSNSVSFKNKVIMIAGGAYAGLSGLGAVVDLLSTGQISNATGAITGAVAGGGVLVGSLINYIRKNRQLNSDIETLSNVDQLTPEEQLNLIHRMSSQGKISAEYSIGENASVTIGTVYNHFTGKEKGGRKL